MGLAIELLLAMIVLLAVVYAASISLIAVELRDLRRYEGSLAAWVLVIIAALTLLAAPIIVSVASTAVAVAMLAPAFIILLLPYRQRVVLGWYSPRWQAAFAVRYIVGATFGAHGRSTRRDVARSLRDLALLRTAETASLIDPVVDVWGRWVDGQMSDEEISRSSGKAMDEMGWVVPELAVVEGSTGPERVAANGPDGSSKAGSVYLRIPRHVRGDVAGWAIEVDHEGYIVRELEFDDAGMVVSVVGVDDYGTWNDSGVGRNPPGSEGFDQFVRNASADVMAAAEFEALWVRATEGR